MHADVRGLLAHTTVAPGDPIVVEARVSSGPDAGYQLVLRAEGQERRISGPSCEQLAQAAALFIALLLDPGLGAGTPAAASRDTAAARPSEPVAATPAGSAAKTSSATRAVARPPGRMEVRAGVELDVGTWPRNLASVRFGVGGTDARFVPGASVAAGMPVRLDVSGGGSLTVMPLGLRLEPALRWARGGWGLEPTGALDLGLALVSAETLIPRRRVAPSLGVGAGLRATRELGAHLRLWLAVGCGVPSWSPRLVVVHAGKIHEPGTALRLGAGLGVLP